MMKRILSCIHSSIIAQMTVKRILLLLGLLVVVVLAAVGLSRPVPEKAIQIIGIVATVFSAMMIVAEMHAGKQANKAERLIELNNYFHDNERLMLIYDALENDKNNGLGAPNFVKVGVVDFAAYCSFYENLGYLLSKGIATISDIDDLFGYRFFMMMHCPYIQETNLLPHSSSWQKIFELYDIWMKYRKSQYHEGDYGKYTAREENCFPEKYLKEKIYMYDKGYIPVSLDIRVPKDDSLVARTLMFEDLPAMLDLQEAALPKELGSDAFFPVTRIEAIESIHRHHVVGLFHQQMLVAWCILVCDDDTDRNLAVAVNLRDVAIHDVLTFDYVAVHPDYRRRGIHHALIDYAIGYAKKKRKAVILAVTSPKNIASRNGFVRKGFEIINPSIPLYGGERLLLKYDILKFE